MLLNKAEYTATLAKQTVSNRLTARLNTRGTWVHMVYISYHFMITSNYLDIPESDFMDVAYMFMSVYYKCYSTDTKCLVRNES